MRKGIVIFVLLAFLSAAALICSHTVVNRARDQVALHETVIYGDRAENTGIKLNLSNNCMRHLFWNTQYELDTVNTANTDFLFSQKELDDSFIAERCGISLTVSGNFGMSSSHAINFSEENFAHAINGLEDMLTDVADRTQAGQTHSERIKYSDYMDYYPITSDYSPSRLMSGELDVSPGTVYDIGNYKSGSFPAVDEFFKIKTDDSASVNIEVTKNAAGDVVGYGMNDQENTPTLHSFSTFADNNEYFTVGNRTGEGNIVDMSLVPGGYGIYMLSYDGSADDGNTIYLDKYKISTVYPLAPETEVLGLYTNKAENRLLLITFESKCYMLTVIDISSMESIQKLELMPLRSENASENVSENDFDADYITAYQFDDFITLLIGDKLAVVTESADNLFKVEFITNVGLSESELAYSEDELVCQIISGKWLFNYWKYEPAMDYNGECLAVASCITDLPNSSGVFGSSGCMLCLAVYGSDGLRCLTIYENSLDAGASDVSWSKRCVPRSGAPLNVIWDS